MKENHPKNSLCHCGSNQLYKFCCIKFEKRTDLININENQSNEKKSIDNAFNLMFSSIAQQRLPLKNYCKENEKYFFSFFLTIEQCDSLEIKLKEKQLTLDILNQFYINKINEFGEQKILEIYESKCKKYHYYKSREVIIKEAIKCHFLGLYSVSIPIFIIQIESILRELGQLDTQDKFRPKITDEEIKDEPLYSIKDDIKYFNFYINKLFEGNKNRNIFNRNTILHGFNLDYYSEINSILMLLTVLEIGSFSWWNENIKNYKTFKTEN